MFPTPKLQAVGLDLKIKASLVSLLSVLRNVAAIEELSASDAHHLRKIEGIETVTAKGAILGRFLGLSNLNTRTKS